MNVAVSVDGIVRDIREQIAVLPTRRRLRNGHFAGRRPGADWRLAKSVCLAPAAFCRRLRLAADASSLTSAVDVRPHRALGQPASVKAACAAARISSESGEPLVARDRTSAPNRVQRRTMPSWSSVARKPAKSATPSV